MWALRRASSSSSSYTLPTKVTRTAPYWTCAQLESAHGNINEKSSIWRPPQFINGRSKKLFSAVQNPCHFSMGSQSLSSQAGAKSGGEEEEDDLEDGFSELETKEATEMSKATHGEEDEELVSDTSDEEVDIEEVPENEFIVDTEGDTSEVVSQKKRIPSTLFKAIIEETQPSIRSALDKYVKDGNDLSRREVWLAMLNLRKRKMFGKALQLSEWLEANKHLEFTERDYASRLDLIAKVRGLQKAESYIENIPKSFRGEVIYRTLLANCVSTTNVKKAEDVFNKMKELGFPLTAFTCNQLLLLYKRFNKKQIADVLLQMERENVKPTLFTYRILIDTKGQSHDISGMDQIVETMKAEGVEPDIHVLSTLAGHYADAGLEEKAESVLKQMEGKNLKENRWVCPLLLPIYAKLGKVDEVRRVWEFCEGKPRQEECRAAIEAWGELKNVEEAEKIFNRMLKFLKRPSSRVFSVMLKVYSDHKMLSQGKDLVKMMGESGCKIGPVTWDALVRLYIEAGEVEKAESLLQKAAQTKEKKPLFNSYIAVMDEFAKRGDVHNAEKILHRMREVGYVSRARPFQTLIQAYINAKAPAYGLKERMKADNIFPNKTMAAQLAQVDPFLRTAVSDLLD